VFTALSLAGLRRQIDARVPKVVIPRVAFCPGGAARTADAWPR
jgi:hypothetical protein